MKEKKRDQFSFMGFGLGTIFFLIISIKFKNFKFRFVSGPRNCIGMKFAYAQMQIALVYLLKNFEFKMADDKKELNLFDFSFPKIHDKIKLIIKKR